MKQWLTNAQPTGKRFDGEPAFYINKSYCPSLIWELTNAVADVRDPSDIGGSDHALNGTRCPISGGMNVCSRLVSKRSTYPTIG
jgi:hypothetical protein